jgi:HEPN domain-containing protein
MHRGDFQELAELHLQHAKALMVAGLYAGAYYMCGYVVECALKACICKRTNQFDFYPSQVQVRKAWSHSFDDLINVSGLKDELDEAMQRDDAFGVHSKAVEDWSQNSRYEPRGQKEAEVLLAAIVDPDHGALAYIKRYW